MFIMVDGIDGSGKSTLVETWENYLTEKGLRVCNIKKITENIHALPQVETILDYDAFISAEPTNAWIGAAIRGELIKKSTDYEPEAIAEAYALDRLVLYKRILIPLLQKNKIIIQDRGISTSLCYQPIQSANISLEYIAKLRGNALALSHRPDHLVIADTPAQVALERLSHRTEKKDDHIFEKKSFLEKARNMFLSEQYQKKFLNEKTKITVLNTNQKIDIVKQTSLVFLQNILE